MIEFREEAKGVLGVPLYEPTDCEWIVNYVKTHEGWEDATVRVQANDGVYDSVTQPALRSAMVLSLRSVSEILQGFDERLEAIIKPLIAQFWGVLLKDHTGTQIVRYSPGGCYSTHQDAGADFEDRYFTIICYLNEDFEGGQTRFPWLAHSAVPETGKAIVFPSKYFHCAEPVLKGEKQVIVSWVMGPIPVKWI
jgi:hypothetical protein